MTENYEPTEEDNEIESKGAEPRAQAILYSAHSSKSVALQKSFRFPCILIGLFGKFPVSQSSRCTIKLIVMSTGPYIDFSAAVWSTRPNMRVLSTALPLCYHQTDTKMRAVVARHVGALRNAPQSLKSCYDPNCNTALPSPDPDLKFLDTKFRITYFHTPIRIPAWRRRRHIISRTSLKWTLPNYSLPRRQRTRRRSVSSSSIVTLRMYIGDVLPSTSLQHCTASKACQVGGT